MKRYAVYWCKVKNKIRPCVLIERGFSRGRVMFVSSSLKSDTTIEFQSRTGKEYKGYLNKDIKIINLTQLLRFISEVTL